MAKKMKVVEVDTMQYSHYGAIASVVTECSRFFEFRDTFDDAKYQAERDGKSVVYAVIETEAKSRIVGYFAS